MTPSLQHNQKRKEMMYNGPATHILQPDITAGILKHRPKRAIGRDGLARGGRLARLVRGRLAVPKGEADEQALAHGILPIGHALKRALLVVDLLVLGHVGLVAEVVKVACVRL